MCNFPCKHVDNSVDNEKFISKFPAGSAGKFVVLGPSDMGGGGVPRGSVARGIRLKCI